MGLYFRRSLLVWLWLCAAGIAGEINLRGAAQVDQAVVRLGDVAELYGLNDAQRDRLMAIELLPAPAAGQARRLTVREVQEAVARQMPELAAWSFAGSSETTITRAAVDAPRTSLAPRGAALSAVDQGRVRDRVEQAILAYVRERLGHDAWSVAAELTAEQLQSLTEAAAIRVTGGRYIDAERVQFRLEADALDSARTLRITAAVTLAPMIVVATRELTRGETISAQDVEQIRADAANTLQKPLESLEDVVGKETTRAIAAGQPITAPSVRSPLLVRRGQVVTVYSRCGGVQIRITGRAKENGAHGDLVPVESITSRDNFHARVSGPQEVEIYAASTTTPSVDDAPREPTPWLASRRAANAAAARRNASTKQSP